MCVHGTTNVHAKKHLEFGNVDEAWDKCDIIITANPNILAAKPEGKISVKIEQPYNKEITADYTFKNMEAVIKDPNRTIIKILEKED